MTTDRGAGIRFAPKSLKRVCMSTFTVIVVTHNRADVLRETLSAISRLTYRDAWEVLVVDNNSSDNTRAVVTQIQHGYPVPLRYLFEGQPGKYYALNQGIQSTTSTFVAATDDDALPQPDWLERAADGLRTYGSGFVGGAVFPVWHGRPPSWVHASHPIVGKVLGLQNHGPEPREYGRAGVSWPLGVNVAYRRDLFDRVGLFDGRLGRVAGTLRNQSQREWHLRARTAGIRGMYLPQMVVHHRVDADRLTRSYFHRWFYWHGVSRAILYRTRGLHLLEPEGDTGHAGERHVLGIPLSLWRQALRSGASAARRHATLRQDDAVQYELMLCFFAGALRQRWSDRGAIIPRPEAPPAHGGEALLSSADAVADQ